MLKFAKSFLFLGMLVARGTDLCSAGFQNSDTDMESDSDTLLLDSFEDLPARPEEQSEWTQPTQNGFPCTTRVAFYVGLDKITGPVTHVTDVVLDNLVTNVGSGYSVSTGRFRAPVSGTYEFGFYVAAKHTQSAAVVMVRNGLTVTILWSEARPNWAPVSKVVVLSLNAGDQVWLQLGHHNWPSYLIEATFSGFLIFRH